MLTTVFLSGLSSLKKKTLVVRILKHLMTFLRTFSSFDIALFFDSFLGILRDLLVLLVVVLWK